MICDKYYLRSFSSLDPTPLRFTPRELLFLTVYGFLRLIKGRPRSELILTPEGDAYSSEIPPKYRPGRSSVDSLRGETPVPEIGGKNESS